MEQEQNIDSKISVNALVIVIFAFVFWLLGKSNAFSVDSAHVKTIMVSILLYLVFIYAISSDGYYIKSRNNGLSEFGPKFGIFVLFFLPGLLVYFFVTYLQVIAFTISFLAFLSMSVWKQSAGNNTFIDLLIPSLEKYFLNKLYSTSEQSESKPKGKVDKIINNANFFLIYVSTIWTISISILILKDFGVLPSELIRNLDFLHLDTVKIIREYILYLVLFILLARAIVLTTINRPDITSRAIPVLVHTYPTKKINGFVKIKIHITKGTISIVNVFIKVFINIIYYIILRRIGLYIMRIFFMVVSGICKIVDNLGVVLIFPLLFTLSYCCFYLFNKTSLGLANYFNGDNGLFWPIICFIALLIVISAVIRLIISAVFTKPNEPIERNLRAYFTIIFDEIIYDTLFVTSFYFIVRAFVGCCILYLLCWGKLIVFSTPGKGFIATLILIALYFSVSFFGVKMIKKEDGNEAEEATLFLVLSKPSWNKTIWSSILIANIFVLSIVVFSFAMNNSMSFANSDKLKRKNQIEHQDVDTLKKNNQTNLFIKEDIHNEDSITVKEISKNENKENELIKKPKTDVGKQPTPTTDIKITKHYDSSLSLLASKNVTVHKAQQNIDSIAKKNINSEEKENKTTPIKNTTDKAIAPKPRKAAVCIYLKSRTRHSLNVLFDNKEIGHLDIDFEMQPLYKAIGTISLKVDATLPHTIIVKRRRRTVYSNTNIKLIPGHVNFFQIDLNKDDDSE